MTSMSFSGRIMITKISVAWLGWRAKRNIHGHIWTIVSLVISGALSLVATMLPSPTTFMAIVKVSHPTKSIIYRRVTD